ncbi:hypothetical protein MYSTI_04961 [Myxococcus stipitatus DSM 14675]|uniref:Lipoprotein n=1 Tax=Myxococcus stipitatus (strain DSM 14675 / JCM 12634 / Mx s8) TaxID=1278073 RepID=L7UIG4_MYXSD|nr:hypothetical protein [Myxococcus stipitatus]AGC46249.1 hypothetical protein MYSTI_04961 [Myxococcus stipitatus DSM 14675]
MNRRNFLFVLLAVQTLIGCGDDAVSYSAPVGINLKAKSSDTVNATVMSQKGISTESGNPFKVFVDNARKELDGKSPGRVELTNLTLTLGAGSVGATSLAEVFSGRVEILFRTEESNNTHIVGHVENPTGSGPVPFTVTFDSKAMSTDDYTLFLAGKFNVVLRGAAAPSFTSKGADVDLQATFAFTAFE